jgi:hypothetical protein
MAYFIFLQSLRSLEEFRKNPHVKITPKSPCANLQSLGIFKTQILFGKEFSPSISDHPAFRPSHGPFSFFFQPADFPSPPPLGLDLPASRAHHHGPIGHRSSSSSRTEAKHGASTGREKRPHLIPLHPPINRHHSPLFNPRNWRLQPRH